MFHVSTKVLTTGLVIPSVASVSTQWLYARYGPTSYGLPDMNLDLELKSLEHDI